MKQHVLDFLHTHDIEHTRHDHDPIHTVEDAQRLANDIPGTHSKNLFLTDKKDYYLVSIHYKKKADMKMLRDILETKKLSFARPEQLEEQLSLTPGSVGIFGMLNAIKEGNKLPNVLIDESLREADHVGRHPNDNSATVVLPQDSIRKVFGIWDIDPQVHPL